MPGTGSNGFWMGSRCQESVAVGFEVWMGSDSRVPRCEEPVSMRFEVWMGSEVPGAGSNRFRGLDGF